MGKEGVPSHLITAKWGCKSRCSCVDLLEGVPPYCWEGLSTGSFVGLWWPYQGCEEGLLVTAPHVTRIDIVGWGKYLLLLESGEVQASHWAFSDATLIRRRDHLNTTGWGCEAQTLCSLHWHHKVRTFLSPGRHVNSSSDTTLAGWAIYCHWVRI